MCDGRVCSFVSVTVRSLESVNASLLLDLNETPGSSPVNDSNANDEERQL